MSEPVIGAFCWNEFMTRDSAKAVEFFKTLFGWDSKQSPLHPGYTVMMNHGKDIGGIMQMGTEFPPDLKPHWMAYIAVKDVDQMAVRAKECGGTVCVPPTDIPNVGRFCVITDPSGGAFCMITLKAPATA